MKTFLRAALLAAALVVLPRLAAAQEAPEQVATRYFESMKAGEWSANAALMHPSALASFKSIFTELAAMDSSGEAGEALGQFFAVSTLAELQALSPQQTYERFMSRFVSTVMGPLLSGADFRTLGSVPEGADTVHVVYRTRMSMMGVPVTQTAVVSLRRDGPGWKVLLTGEVEGMLAGLKAGLLQGDPDDEVPEEPEESEDP